MLSGMHALGDHALIAARACNADTPSTLRSSLPCVGYSARKSQTCWRMPGYHVMIIEFLLPYSHAPDRIVFFVSSSYLGNAGRSILVVVTSEEKLTGFFRCGRHRANYVLGIVTRGQFDRPVVPVGKSARVENLDCASNSCWIVWQRGSPRCTFSPQTFTEGCWVENFKSKGGCVTHPTCPYNTFPELCRRKTTARDGGT
ncbi:hypothetical protein EI94DRAFT_1093785 [Lactarius quietus]|nr:hypothetical protein EI94DRAFT_1093785 [Lactarius quietus]